VNRRVKLKFDLFNDLSVDANTALSDQSARLALGFGEMQTYQDFTDSRLLRERKTLANFFGHGPLLVPRLEIVERRPGRRDLRLSLPDAGREIARIRVSAHLLIRRDGEMVQYVPLRARAWHAGESCFQGRLSCNDFSIGVELEGADDVPYEAVQYQRLAAVARVLMAAWPLITVERWLGDFEQAPFKDEVRPRILFENANHLLGLNLERTPAP